MTGPDDTGCRRRRWQHRGSRCSFGEVPNEVLPGCRPPDREHIQAITHANVDGTLSCSSLLALS
jgi:hypothetical protein